VSISGPTLMEAQPLLSQLLQVMESGRGYRILTLRCSAFGIDQDGDHPFPLNLSL